MARTPVITAAVLGLALAAAAQAADPWWSQAWAYRRALAVPGDDALTALPGDDVAAAAFFTGGLCLSDGSDIRVTTDRGQPVPARVLMTGPGDVASVAFACRRDVKKYYAYLGNAAPKGGEALALSRGLLMETWEYDGGPTATLEQARRIVEAPGRILMGRRFVDRLFLGYSPFGPASALASRFTGTLKCPRDGEYTFVISSQNASFLTIDDAPVVADPGHHPPQHTIRVQGKATLKAGPHKLTFYHVSRGGDPIVVAAWRLPGEEAVRVIPPGGFAPVATATPGGLWSREGSPCVDFSADNAGEAFIDDRYLHRYDFRAAGTALPGPQVAWSWDFGDGQRADGPEARHVYLRPGAAVVTLTGKTPQATYTRTNRVFVSRAWEKIVHTETEPLAGYAQIVSTYDFTKADPETVLAAMLLCEREGQAAAVLKAGAALAVRPKLPAHVAQTGIGMYADRLVADSPAQAADVLATCAGKADNPAAAASMLARAAEFYLQAGDDKAAEAALNVVAAQYAALLNGGQLRTTRIAQGDLWSWRGDLEKARSAYRAAGQAGEFAGKNEAFIRGDFARHVEAYIRQKDFAWAREVLDKWLDACPEDRLEGYATLLTVRLLTATKEPARAADAAARLVRVNPGSSYAPSLLLEGAAACAQAGREDRRKAMLEQLLKDYPESAACDEARGLLKK
ncbi:MAG: PA14 domain-containing protein [Planctomycetota bacterium]|nr:PA14 domain-containing protein [Planctomycetota bacterium]